MRRMRPYISSVRKCLYAGFAVVALCLSAVTSCEREPALYLCEHDAQVTGPERIAVDWSRFTYFETPTGMTVNLFQRNDSGVYQLYQTTSTNDITHVDYLLPPGDYADFVINQSEYEFGSVTFHDLDDWDNALLRTTQSASQWYKDTISTSPLVSNIEWIGTDRHVSVPLTQETIDSAAGALVTIDTLRPVNIVRTVTVYVHIKNITSLQSARASLQGLAGSYYLGRGHTSSDKVTELLESWSMSIDSTTADGRQDGTIEARISTLGLPEGHSMRPDDNNLHLQCLLKNDSVLNYNYEVGDKFKYVTNVNINVDLDFYIDIVIEEPLPDVPEEEVSSGFDVTVDDWDKERGIAIEM